MALFIAVLGGLAIERTPTDVLPPIDIPVIAVIWSFGGMLPKEMESRMITVDERAMTTTVNDIEHIESQTYPGVGVIKVFFQPNANIAAANAQVTSINQTLLRAFPPGTTPPLIIQFSASAVPILQLGISGKGMSTTDLFDAASNFIRTQLATVQGASVPTPYGGSMRQIACDLDIPALQARGLSPTDVENAVSAQNIIAPSGTVKIGDTEYNVRTNVQPDVIDDFNKIPIKVVNGATVRIGDVANVHDGHVVPTNNVIQNGQPGVLLTILKNGNASTLDVVSRVKQALPGILSTVSKNIQVRQMFDQSIFVRASVEGVVREALMAALLTALMILIFLGSWRSTFVVATSIPLCILASIVIFSALGQTINIMTLGGLSLAVGILVDDATVEIENTNRNLAMGGKSLTRAILDGAAQIATPTFVATLCICIVFIPVIFLTGTARSLFVPLAEAVVFAMLMSYLLSRSLVPVMVQFLMRPDVDRIVAEEHGEAHHEFHTVRPGAEVGAGLPGGAHGHAAANGGSGNGAIDATGNGLDEDGDSTAGDDAYGEEAEDVDEQVPGDQRAAEKALRGDIFWRFHHRFNHYFSNFRERYVGALRWALHHRGISGLGFLAFFAASLALFPLIGEDFFPSVDAGQINLHVQGPPGQRIEQTTHLFTRVEKEIRSIIPNKEVDNILENIGLPASGINLVNSSSVTIGALDGDIQVSLKEEHGPTPEYVARLRKELPKKFPHAEFFFTPADITTQILNFGLPAPIDIQLVGRDPALYGVAQKIARDVRGIPGAADVHVHQVNNVPELDVKVDRERAQDVGLTEKDVVGNLLASLVGTGQVTPSFWVDPKNGVSYGVFVQTPQRAIADISDVYNTPIQPSGAIAPNGGPLGAGQQMQLLGNLAPVTRSVSPQIVDHYNVQPTYDVFVSTAGRDLGGVASDVSRTVAKYEKGLPRGSKLVMRGQVQSMYSSFAGLGFGLIFAVVLVYLLMVVNFQSWLDPFIIIMALPGAISGILWILFITQTTINVPSLMGSIMCIGVATSNSILLITFANERRHEGDDAITAALAAGYTRLRPVLMTAGALIAGMMPMALGLGEGGEQNAPLGRAVIGGATVATFTTLFFVPIVYTILRHRQIKPTESEIEIDRYAADEEDIRINRMREAQRIGAGADWQEAENGAGNGKSDPDASGPMNPQHVPA
jgi:multidrug efflux pump subunit AcrB